MSDGTAVCNCLALRQAARRTTQAYDRALAPIGLRATQYSTLAILRGAGGLPIQQLARLLGMDRATLGHNLRPLEARGWVVQAPGADRRERIATLTESGHAVLAAAHPYWLAAQKRFEAKIGAARSEILRAELARVAALLSHP